MDTQNTSTDVGEDRHVIATYVSDMLALERHISAPVDAQLASQDHQDYAQAIALIQQIKTTCDSHIAALEQLLSTRGGNAASPIKSAVSTVLGGGAAVINKMRKTKVSKSLRDDSTALSLAAISYTMLNATALGLGDQATAALAKRHLDDVAPLIVSISKAMPTVVLQELRDTGENVAVSASASSQQQTGDSWSDSNIGASNGGKL
ncbi:MAG: hypothetical protein M3R53_05305 [Candidatus Eremiobacteraeota bacterium]|nr:hypothetical protein [Candidatus Eremiobacteraeota bacterium]